MNQPVFHACQRKTSIINTQKGLSLVQVGTDESLQSAVCPYERDDDGERGERLNPLACQAVQSYAVLILDDS